MAVDYAKYITEYFSFLEGGGKELVKSLGCNSSCGKPFIVELRDSLLRLLQSPGFRVNSVDEFSSRLLALATQPPPLTDFFDFDNLFKKMISSYSVWKLKNKLSRQDYMVGLKNIYNVSGILFNTDGYYDNKLPKMDKSARTKLIKKVQALAQGYMADMYEQWRGNGEALARQYEMQPKKGILKVSVLTQPSSSDNSDSNSASSRSRSPSQSSLSSGD